MISPPVPLVSIAVFIAVISFEVITDVSLLFLRLAALASTGTLVTANRKTNMIERYLTCNLQFIFNLCFMRNLLFH